MAQRFTDGRPVRTGGFAIRSSGVTGIAADAVLSDPSTTPGRAAAGLENSLRRAGVSGEGAQALATAADERGLVLSRILPLAELTSRQTSATGSARGNRAGDEGPALAITVPAPPLHDQQVVLEVDATGVLRWHFPQPADRAEASPGSRATTDRHAFRIPVSRIPVPDAATGAPATDRGVIAFGVRKSLHLLRFPIETGAGIVGGRLVRQWEQARRPYGLGVVTTGSIGASIDGLTPGPAEWDTLAQGPVLLLVHGTFSRGRSAFAGLYDVPARFDLLAARYDGRVLMFDHPTLHVDPSANAAWLAEQLPAGQPLAFDVVAHSRGGLVGRSLPAAFAAAGKPATVRTLVHVATPNAGTVLAGRERLDDLLDSFTTLVSLLPGEEVAVPVAGILEVVKQVATGVRDGLDGLSAMDPKGTYLQGIDEPVPESMVCRAIAADFKGSASLAARALDRLMDGIFQCPNDLVVPTDGVHQADRYRIADAVILPAGGVGHLGLFHNPTVRERLGAWLPG